MSDEPIVLELPGSSVSVQRDLVRTLAAAAAAHAGVSSRHRELSLLLGQALDSGRVTLDSDAERTLRAVLEEKGLTLS